jgi:hypothetical protein
MNTFFYGKAQIITNPTTTTNPDGSITLFNTLDTGKTVKVFQFTLADLATLATLAKNAKPETGIAKVSKAKTDTTTTELEALKEELATFKHLLLSLSKSPLSETVPTPKKRGTK